MIGLPEKAALERLVRLAQEIKHLEKSTITQRLRNELNIPREESIADVAAPIVGNRKARRKATAIERRKRHD